MKILRKPLYVGTRFHALEIELRSNRSQSYAERSRIARAEAGKSLLGSVVCGVRIGGKECVVPAEEFGRLPDTYRVNWTGRITSCDDQGVIAIE